MKYLIVDDESLIIDGMVQTLKAANSEICDEDIFTAMDPNEALKIMQEHMPDIIFSDVDMPVMNGLKLAGKIHEINPEADIIFCTGYAHYSLDAWKTEAKAFALKPVTVDDMQAILKRIYDNRAKMTQSGSGSQEPVLKAQCFGNFEIFYDGNPVHFSRKKSKEMLAYLIDRRGSMISTGEIRTALWDEEEDNEEKKGYIRVLANDIRKSMEDIGIFNFLKNDMDCYGIDANAISCDYFDYLNGDEKAKAGFAGEYMLQYPWAEVTMASLLDRD